MKNKNSFSLSFNDNQVLDVKTHLIFFQSGLKFKWKN